MRRYKITQVIENSEWVVTVRDEIDGIVLQKFKNRLFSLARNMARELVLDMAENDRRLGRC